MSRAFVREKDVDYLEGLPKHRSRNIRTTSPRRAWPKSNMLSLQPAKPTSLRKRRPIARRLLQRDEVFAIGLPGARRRVSHRNRLTGLKSGSAPQ